MNGYREKKDGSSLSIKKIFQIIAGRYLINKNESKKIRSLHLSETLHSIPLGEPPPARAKVRQQTSAAPAASRTRAHSESVAPVV